MHSVNPHGAQHHPKPPTHHQPLRGRSKLSLRPSCCTIIIITIIIMLHHHAAPSCCTIIIIIITIIISAIMLHLLCLFDTLVRLPQA
jgi:hypothetical protein